MANSWAVYGAILLLAVVILLLVESLRGIGEAEEEEKLEDQRPSWRRNQEGR